MYEMFHPIPFTKAGADGRVKLHEALGYMMDCCQFQEYQEKAFCDYLRRNGIAIFLFSIQLDILRLPSFRENVRTSVKIYGCKSIYGLRRITMRDEAGELCILSNAAGAFFDTLHGKALKLDPASLPVKFDEPEEMECLPRKIPIPAGQASAGQPIRISRSLLDPNGHLTSPIYLAAAQDALPEDFDFNRVRIEFKKQILPGDFVTPFLHDAGAGKMVVDLRNGAGESCAAAEFSSFSLLP